VALAGTCNGAPAAPQTRRLEPAMVAATAAHRFLRTRGHPLQLEAHGVWCMV
jgi:hypothetical protein